MGFFEDVRLRLTPPTAARRVPPSYGPRVATVFKNPIPSGTENGSVYEKKIIAYITMYAVDSYCLYKGETDRSRS